MSNQQQTDKVPLNEANENDGDNDDRGADDYDPDSEERKNYKKHMSEDIKDMHSQEDKSSSKKQQQMCSCEVSAQDQLKKEGLDKIRKKKIEKQFIEDQKQFDKLLHSDSKPKKRTLGTPQKLQYDDEQAIVENKRKIKRHKSHSHIVPEDPTSSASSDNDQESEQKSTQPLKKTQSIEILSEREEDRYKKNRWHYGRQLQQSKQLSSDNQEEQQPDSEPSINDEILEEDEEEDEDEEDKNNVNFNSKHQLIVEPKKSAQIDVIKEQIKQLESMKQQLEIQRQKELLEKKQKKEQQKKEKQKKREEEKKKQSMMQENQKKKSFSWQSYRRLLRYSVDQWKLMLFAFLFTIGQSATQMYIPKISGELLDSTIQQNSLQTLNNLAFNAIFVFMLNALCQFLRTFLMNIVGEKIVIALKNDCFAHFIKSDVEFHDRQKSGELVSRLTNDIASARSAASGNLGSFIRNSLLCIGNLYLLIKMSWKLSMMIIFLIPVFILSSSYYVNYCKKISKKYQKFMAKISGIATECFMNIRTIKSFSNEQKEIQRLNKKTNKAYKLGQDSSLSLGLYNGVEGLVSNIAILGVLWYGGYLVLEKESITSGQLASFIMYTTSLSDATQSISASLQKIFSASGACEKLFQLMDQEPQIKYSLGQTVTNLTGQIEFVNVDFSYPTSNDVKVLQGLNLTISTHEQVAFVGPSGCGKSTAVRLIMRFYDITNGMIKINGQDIKSLELKSLRQLIGYVSQEPTLFSGTLQSNICYGIQDYTQHELEEACRMAYALDFINDKQQFPDGFKTIVGEYGVKLSGGQKQRIAIARALIKKPKVLIFDEATSALDAESEYQVQGAIDELINKTKITIIVIAHKLATIKNFKKIAIFESGQIIAMGNHDSLMKTCSLYNNLVQLQHITNQTSSSIKKASTDPGIQSSKIK